MITRMSTGEAFELLREKRLGRLGCVADGEEPYVVPVNYVFEEGAVLSHSLPGRKIAAMRRRPRVCLQVDDIADQFRWRSVLAYGTYGEVEGRAERVRAMNLLLALFPRLTPVESLIAEDAAAPAPVIYRIRLDSVTGIREG